jgi:hypothetical protein
MATYTLIDSEVLTASQASVTFSSIPATYTDLVLRISARTNRANATDFIRARFNGDTATNYSKTQLYGSGNAGAASNNNTGQTGTEVAWTDAANATADTYGNFEIYIPSYNAVQKKQASSFSAQEDNSASAYISVFANLWQGTAAITEINLYSSTSNSFVSGSSFYLYGISNA